MDTGTFYLYEYENNARKRNAGFLKISRHYQSCIFQVHLRSISLENASEAEMYAFFFKETQICAKQIAHFSIDSLTHKIRFCAPESSFPECRRLESIDGFFLKCSESPSLWFTPNCPEKINSDQIYFSDTDAGIQDETQSDDDSDIHDNMRSDDVSDIQDNLRSDAVSDIQGDAQSDAVSDIHGEVQQNAVSEVSDEPEQCSAEKSSETSCRTTLSPPRKLSLSDLTILPRRFWSLSSNSFLLHGYHNYGHLLLIEQNGRLWLGVPGVYDLREARAADLFGFPRFCRSYAASTMLTDEERNTSADFGHWFRCVGSRPK